MLSEQHKARLFGVGLATLAAVIPFSTKLASIVTILLALIWLIEGKWKFKWQLIKQNRLLQMFVGFYVLHIVGLLYSENVSAGMFDLEKKLSLLLLPLIIGSSTLLRTDTTLKERIHTWFIVSCFATLIFCFGHAVYRYLAEIPPVSSVYGGFEATQKFKSANEASGIWEYITYSELLLPLKSHPTYISIYLLLIISILLDKVSTSIESKKKLIILLYLFLIVYFTAAIFLLSSRVAILLYAVVLGIYFFKYLRKQLSWRLLIAGGVACLLALGVIINYVPVVKHRFTSDIEGIGQSYQSNNPGTGMMMRMAFWKTALNVVEEHPLFGVGTGDGSHAMNLEYQNNGMAALQGYNPHNQYLQTSIMLGLPGIALLILLLIFQFVTAWRKDDVIYMTFIAIISISFLTESVLQANKGIVFFALFSSVYFITSNQKTYKKG